MSAPSAVAIPACTGSSSSESVATPSDVASPVVSDYADESLYAGLPVDLSRITSELYLCNFATSLKVDVLQSAGIRTIIYLHYLPKTEVSLRKYEQAGIAHHYLVCYDSPHEKIAKHIDKVVTLLESKAVGAAGPASPFPVLFHCQEGISRSPALVIAWLMHSQRLSYAEAKAIVKAQRAVIRPNEGFEKQLRLFEQKIKTETQQ